MLERTSLFIGGRWQRGRGDAIEVVDPATEEVAGRCVAAAAADVDQAVTAARAAFDDGPWPRLSMGERADLLDRAWDLMAPRLAEVAPIVSAEMGLPITISRAIAETQSAGVWTYTTGLARTFELREERATTPPAVVLSEPVGVVAAIAPWNSPWLQALYKIVYPLVAGCPVILKPAPETPFDCFLVAEALEEAGAPPGILSILPGGRELGELVVRHPGVDKVSFTGSTAAGRRIGAICGEHLKRCALELGGKSAAIVLEDADLDAALPALAMGAFTNAGQICAANSRILVAERRRDELLDRLVAHARAIAVGDPLDPATQMGPLVAERQRDRVEAYVRDGVASGALLVAGGGRPEHLDRGWFIEPTVFADVDNSSRIAQEEIFGPVVTVTTFAGEQDAIDLANDSTYGLHGAVFTPDLQRAMSVAASVRTGSFSINGFTSNMQAPFGGYKSSGIGRKFGREGLDAYFEKKTVNLC